MTQKDKELLLRDLCARLPYGVMCDIGLEPPTYSRKLYKMGFVCPRHFGNSYKMCNYKVNKFFNNHS